MSRVIVVGGGLSGLSACHAVYERGANVTILDKNPFFGGNSTKATSGISGAGTRVQQGLDIPDTAKIFFDDTKKSARELARDDLIEVLTGKSGEAVHWLMDRFDLDLSKVSRLGGATWPRTHRGTAQFPGMEITMRLMERLEDLAEKEPDRVELKKKARVTKLIKEGDAVVGVEYDQGGEHHKIFGQIILATGGYAADFDAADKGGLLAKHRPELLHLPTTNGSYSTGDGQKMVLEIQGAAIDLEKVQVHPTGLIDPNEPDAKVKFLAAEALRGCGALLLDKDGNRFVDELQHRDFVTQKIWDLGKGKLPVRLVLNGEATREIEWHCKHYCGRGLMKRFETAAEVAKEMGIPESKLKETFEGYMKIAESKNDPFKKKFFSNLNWNFDKSSGPYHVALMTPVLHYTMGGVEISPKSEVMHQNGKPIPGLFASGELAGGVHGANRLGGSSLLGCVVFGRVAGDSAASALMKHLSSSSGPQQRLTQIGGHLGMATTVRIDPGSQKVHLEFAWGEQGQGQGQTGQSQGGGGGGGSGASGSQQGKETKTAKPGELSEERKPEGGQLKEYSLEEVAKHNTKDDCWVAVNGQVLDVTNFLEDHPGGVKALLIQAGKECSEEFNMVHDKSVIAKYAGSTVIGTYKEK